MTNFLREYFLVLALIFMSFGAQAQSTEKVWRVNVLNPGMELEIPTGTFSTFSANAGIGYDGGYPELTYGGSGFTYLISPFIDLQQKWFYNLEKRMAKDRNTSHNSGNFISLRMKSNGPSIVKNISRTSDFDFAVGPTWGIQRFYNGKFHLLFDMGPQYYFDLNGNAGFFPVMIQLNLGFDL